MQVIRQWESVQLSSAVLAIGNFDGVHLGHQAILAAGRRRADATGTLLAAMTFDPHPLSIITPEHAPATLTPVAEKLRWLEAAGVDVAVVVKSLPEFFHLSADVFIRQVVLDRFHPVAVVEGPSFRFGAHRQGTVETLREAGRQHGFEVEIVEPVRAALGGHPETVISSSLVRELIRGGNVDQAALCLGRPYALLGTVSPGAGRGRSLGFPTANIEVAGQLIPPEGVYAGLVELDHQRRLLAAVNIGKSPTFATTEPTIEAHLLDFAGDLYRQSLRLELLQWLRPQHHFDSIESLARQIERDVEQVRRSVGE